MSLKDIYTEVMKAKLPKNHKLTNVLPKKAYWIFNIIYGENKDLIYVWNIFKYK